jgi:hypothetical protein
MSLGGGEYSSYCDYSILKPAIDNLNAAGIATVISSGNESLCDAVSAPACISSAIAVGSTTKSDEESNFSNWHTDLLDLFAPGSSIYSAHITSDEHYISHSGTYMAAPHIAGAWAIIRQLDENKTVKEVLDILKDTGTGITTKCGTGLQKSRINVSEFLMSLLTVAPPINLSAEQEKNQSLLQIEYINLLTWERNPHNEGKNVTHYKIYLVEGNQLVFLGQVDSSTFMYMHRKAGKRVTRTYGISAINDEGEESPQYYHTIDLGITQ